MIELLKRHRQILINEVLEIIKQINYNGADKWEINKMNIKNLTIFKYKLLCILWEKEDKKDELKMENYYEDQKIINAGLGFMEINKYFMYNFNRVEIINWTNKPITLKEGRNIPSHVEIKYQDGGRTLKIFLT